MTADSPTLRLLMPQWQGGNNPSYAFGARLLAWLTRDNDGPLVEVPIEPYDGSRPDEEAGIVARAALMRQLKAARSLIEAHQPDRIVVFGGDCLVEQAPFAYLNERYGGELGVLWVDAHPDIKTTDDFVHGHTMVLGNLLGGGDSEFANEVKVRLQPENVMFAGLREGTTEQEDDVIDRLQLRYARPEQLADSSAPVLDWIRERNIKQIAIHCDLDVLDPVFFRSLLFANPVPDPDAVLDYPMGKLRAEQLTRLMRDVSGATDVVGLGITEHLPWDAINLKAMLDQFPLL